MSEQSWVTGDQPWMSGGQAWDEPRDQRALAAVAVGAVLLVLPALIVGGGFRIVDVLGVSVAAVLVVARRDSPHALAGLGIVALLWATSGIAAASVWTLVVAVLLCVGHVALALRSAVPPGADLGRDLLRRWCARLGVVLGLTVATYGVAVLLDRMHRADNTAVVAIALIVLAGVVLALRREILGGRA